MTTVKEAIYGDAGYTGTVTRPRTVKEVIYSDEGYAFTPAEQSAWYDVLAKFERAVREFDQAAAGLRARATIAARDPTLRAEYESLVGRAASMESKIRYIRQAVDDVKAALLGAWNSVTGVWSRVMTYIGLHGLDWTLQGLPLIPIAAVVAATSLLTAFVADYAKFARRADLFESLVAQGRSPGEAAAVIARIQPDAPLINIAGSPVVWLIAAGVAFWLLKERMR